MDCGCIQDLILEYFDGVLSAEDSRRVDEHVAVCSRCRQSFGAQQQLDAVFASAPAPLPRPGFDRRVLRLIDSAPEPRRLSRIAEVLDLLGYATVIAAGGVIAQTVLSMPALAGMAPDAANYALWTAGAAAVGYLVWWELKPARM